MSTTMLLYDVPDGNPLPRPWLEALDDEDVFAQIAMVERRGPVFCGCQGLPDGLWALEMPIGFGQIARLLFFMLPTGDFLAVHGFTGRGAGDASEYAIAIRRKRELIE